LPEKKSFYPIIEAVLFTASEPVSTEQFSKSLGEIPWREIPSAIEHLNSEYEKQGRSFRIVEVAGGYRMETLPQYSPYLERFFRGRTPPKLSRACLETLSIIAYRQPITRSEIDAIRGIQSDGPIRTLIDRGLISVIGRSEKIGRAMLYGTTDAFLLYFGLKSIDELPEPEDIKSVFQRIDERKEESRTESGESPPEVAAAPDAAADETDTENQSKANTRDENITEEMQVDESPADKNDQDESSSDEEPAAVE